MKVMSIADNQVLAEKTGIREKVIGEIQKIAAGYVSFGTAAVKKSNR